MTGLEKIIAQIKLDADNSVKVIRERNDSECSKILDDAKIESQSILKDGEIKALKKYDDVIARANSAAELEERKIMLSAKQSVIATMISNSIDSLINLPDDKYFELIYKMISKHSEKLDGVISLSDADLKRLPSDFEEKANAASKGKLTLSKVPASIDGGFILVYGGVDVNCSFSALYSDNSEKISDAVAKLLFS